ncbi:acyl-CoA dehydrogenase [Cystobacter fuscus]|nr:acyl-CoA dehydrogenase [Cystobacter fuscus]
MDLKRLSLGELLGAADQVAREVVAPEVTRVDGEGRWPETGLRALQAAGLGGLVVPAAFGGQGQGLVALARTCEVLGRVCASTAICFGMHCVGSAVLAAKATSFHQRTFLEPIAAGKHLTTLALSESGTGAHFYLPQTRLTAVPGGYRLEGAKSFVTNGGHADSYVVSTLASGEAAQPGDFSCVILPAQAEHLAWEGSWEGVGMRGNSARTLRLQDVFVPATHLLGQQGDEIWYVFNVVAPYFLIAMAGTYLGIASSALEEATAHLKRRHYAHGGASPSSQAVLQHRLGTLWAVVERTRLLIHSAAARGDQGEATALAALCSAKAEVADCAVHVVNEAMTLVGGQGYSESGSPLFRHLRDARAAHVMSPTTDILRTWVGRALLDLPLLGD